MKSHLFGYLLGLGIMVSCNVSTDSRRNAGSRAFEGNYVTPDYYRRAEGYDWMVVSIDPRSATTAGISVRSRSDIKGPSCSFDYVGYFTESGDTLISEYEGNDIYFVLSSDTLLTISSDVPELLYFFCSGGGSIAGEYVKLREKLDETQLK